MQVKVINKIGEKIEEHRQKYGSSQAWIAEQIGESRQQLNRIINSDRIYLHHLIKLSIVLNCDIKDLYDYEIIK